VLDTPDWLIVGAGSAGCVLADRLSARGDSVVVLEAGDDVIGRNDVEGLWSPSFFDAVSTPGRIWDGLSARPMSGAEPRPYLRGRGVGGSSMVNAMVALWGEVDDYDGWERDFGCRGWSWRDVEPAFRRLESAVRRAEHVEPTRLGGALIEACRADGWLPHRGPFPLGAVGADVGPASLTIDESGRRAGAVDRLERARRRLAVTVLCGRLVDRVLIENGRARGVLLQDGSEMAGRRVVISAGAIHTPGILVRSGIDRPGIGRGLQDHPSMSITAELVPDSSDTTPTPRPAVSALARFSSGAAAADLQLLPIDHLGAFAGGFGSLAVAVMRPWSRGSVIVESDDPRVQPRVELGLLADERDVVAMERGAEVLGRLVSSGDLDSAVSAWFVDDAGTRWDGSMLEGDRLGELIRSRTGDYVHASGTARMGDPTDELTVVDPSGWVVGVEGLAVCDASVMPRLPRANTHLPTMMIAEVMSSRW